MYLDLQRVETYHYNPLKGWYARNSKGLYLNKNCEWGEELVWWQSVKSLRVAMEKVFAPRVRQAC